MTWANHGGRNVAYGQIAGPNVLNDLSHRRFYNDSQGLGHDEWDLSRTGPHHTTPAMAPPILMLTDIDLTFGGTPLLEGADLSVRPGDRLCLVGRNGSGKSTLLKIAAGLVEPDAGKRFVQPGTTVRYLPQAPDFGAAETVGDYVESGLGPADDPRTAHRLLERFHLDPTAEPGRLSGGEARRAALARTLAPRPDVLLLDEPTNHLDLPAIEWLETELKSQRAALVLISHDRRLMDTVGRSVVWLDRGTTRERDAGFAGFEDWRDSILATERVGHAKLDKRIAAEREWVNKGVTARRKRNMGRLRALQALRQERRDIRKQTGTVAMTATETELAAKRVIEIRNATKAFGDRTIVAPTSLRVMRGERLGIVGPNGAGKTTLLNILTGTLPPDSGTVKLAQNLEVATLDQGRQAISDTETLEHALTGGGSDHVEIDGKPRHVIGYMKDFLFLPEQRFTPVGALSGGERARLLLARVLARPSNLLVLDEPTNDLDLETLDILQEMLGEYSGTVIVVSHDRDFLDRVATQIVAAEGNGTWQTYAGGYSDLLAQRGTAPTKAMDDVVDRGAEKQKAGKRKPKSPSAGKMSFKDKHALKTLPSVIEGLEAEIARLQSVLDDPDLYRRDADAFQKTTDALTEAQSNLAAAEDEWLRVEMLREEIEGG